METVKTECSVYFLRCPCLKGVGQLCLGPGRFFLGPIFGFFLVLSWLLIFWALSILDYTGVCSFSPLEGLYNFHSHTFYVYKFLHSPYCYYLSIRYLEISNFQQNWLFKVQNQPDPILLVMKGKRFFNCLFTKQTYVFCKWTITHIKTFNSVRKNLFSPTRASRVGLK